MFINNNYNDNNIKNFIKIFLNLNIRVGLHTIEDLVLQVIYNWLLEVTNVVSYYNTIRNNYLYTNNSCRAFKISLNRGLSTTYCDSKRYNTLIQYKF